MVKINFEVQKKSLYWILAFVLVLASAVTVYAWANSATGVGHDHSEIEPCGEGEILKIVGGSWDCVVISASSEFDGNLNGDLIVSGVITAPAGNNVVIKLPAVS